MHINPPTNIKLQNRFIGTHTTRYERIFYRMNYEQIINLLKEMREKNIVNNVILREMEEDYVVTIEWPYLMKSEEDQDTDIQILSFRSWDEWESKKHLIC